MQGRCGDDTRLNESLTAAVNLQNSISIPGSLLEKKDIIKNQAEIHYVGCSLSLFLCSLVEVVLFRASLTLGRVRKSIN